MDRYRKRLAQDLERWIADGLVSADHKDAILASASSGSRLWSASGAAAILGAVLLGLAAISFTAANWAELPRLARFAILIGALWACYVGAGAAFRSKSEPAGHALALLGAALFGAAIALTAQTFNMSAFRNTGVLIWTLGAFITAIAIPSRPVLILTALLAAFWTALETGNPLAPPIIWGFAPLWIILAAAASRLRSLVSLNVLSAALTVWVAHTLYELGRFDTGERALFSDMERLALYTLIMGALAMIAGLARDRAVFGAGAVAGWTAAAALLGAFALQLPLDRDVEIIAQSRIYVMSAIVALVLLGGAALLRRDGGALHPFAAGAIVAAASLAAALPGVQQVFAGALALEFAAGAAVYALAAALILNGARQNRRFIGGLGIALFIGQSLYVYAELFGDLLNTALFFFIGGLVLFALSFVLTRFQRTLRSEKEAAS